MKDARFEQARLLCQQGRAREASTLLDKVLDADPDNVGARYLLAVCLTECGPHAEAKRQLSRVLAAHPGHYEAAYRLGCLRQEDRDFRGAAETFRQVLNFRNFQDTEARLRYCESAITNGTPSPPQPLSEDTAVLAPIRPNRTEAIIPGPAPVRRIIETSRSAVPGKLVIKVNTKMRYFAPQFRRLFTLAVIVALLPAIVAIGERLPLVTDVIEGSIGILNGLVSVRDVYWWAMGILWLACIPIALLAMVVQSRMNSAALYEYGMDVKSGVINTSRQFIWYYQITQTPTYFQEGWWDRLANTASLRVRYNDSTLTTRNVELNGIGTSRQVEEVRAYLLSRIPSERFHIRGLFI